MENFHFDQTGTGENDTLPSPTTNFYAVPVVSSTTINLTWVNPTGSEFSGTRIQRKVGSMPENVQDGTKVYDGQGTGFIDTNIQLDTNYHYRTFPYNNKKQYQTELSTGSIANAMITANNIYSY